MAMRLTVRASVCRPAAVRVSRCTAVNRTPQRLSLIARANSAEVGSKVESAIKEAEETCATKTTADCAVAWDNVEELSAELKKKKEAELAANDPLEKYCGENPEADECRIYED